MSQQIDIPYGENLEGLKKCVTGIGCTYKVMKRTQMIRVFYETPIALYWLGCNVVAHSAGLFESSITTHAANSKNNGNHKG